jgi:RIO kinase 1
MHIPESLVPLMDQGIIEEVLRPLMSGKEAQIYLVMSEGAPRVAKVYKEAQARTFKHRAEYTEGRGSRNTRTQRAIQRHSRYGRAQDESTWRTTEVDMIYRLRAAGVRVPEPFHFVEGVLVMELISDAGGDPGPRLADASLERDEAVAIFDTLLAEVVRMLHAGVVHGDLSDFNVLLGADGPVIIDFPQAVDAAQNQNARKLLIRDVENLTRFLSRFVPGRRPRPYGQELWEIYARGQLAPDTRLTGLFRSSPRKADVPAVLEEIQTAEREAHFRREAMGLIPARRRHKPKAPEPPAAAPAAAPAEGNGTSDRGPVAAAAGAPQGSPPPRRRRRRRRPRSSTGPSGPKTPIVSSR